MFRYILERTIILRITTRITISRIFIITITTFLSGSLVGPILTIILRRRIIIRIIRIIRRIISPHLFQQA